MVDESREIIEKIVLSFWGTGKKITPEMFAEIENEIEKQKEDYRWRTDPLQIGGWLKEAWWVLLGIFSVDRP